MIILKVVTCIVRSFQAGTGENGKLFDEYLFEKKVQNPIRRLFQTTKTVIGDLIILVNTEIGNPLAEIIDSNGKTPTQIAFEKSFPNEITSGKIVVHLCKKWGDNPGSATALNTGLEIANNNNAKWVLIWSPEIDLDGDYVETALEYAKEKNLAVVGVLRERHWERPQWKVPQNTVALWNLKTLLSVKGFSESCNGVGKKVLTKEFGEVPLAGMEDFHAMLKLLSNDNDPFNWGVIGRKKPLKWNVDFGGERERRHLEKVARQYAVMEAWANEIFPNIQFEKIMDNLFSCGCEI